jgi:signal transduction histidine kinase
LLSLIFYWASSFAAGQGIAPIHQLIDAANKTDDQNRGIRLPLPPRRDEIYLLATTINALLQRIEHSLQREKQITADISHELRTPLAGIRGNLEVLLRKRREPEQYELKIEQVLRETDRMNKLLEQLLQLSRIETGHIKPNTEQIELQPFCTSFLKKWETLLAEKQLHLELVIPPKTTILADASLLEVILGNLLSNTLKYGSKGSTLSISWNEATHTLAFADNGRGISTEHLPHIFDRFYRADASRNTKIPGTGLGLSISKKMADLQGIQLTVQSEAGRGTTFFMQLKVKT